MDGNYFALCTLGSQLRQKIYSFECLTETQVMKMKFIVLCWTTKRESSIVFRVSASQMGGIQIVCQREPLLFPLQSQENSAKALRSGSKTKQ